MTDTVFDGVQTWLTHPLCFLPSSPLFSFYSSLSISLFRPPACLLGSSPLPPISPPFFWPYCFTSLHSVFYGCFVLVQTHLTAGWWVPPPVIAAIYYQRRSTSHISDFGKMVFTLDRFTDSPYNKSSEKCTCAFTHKAISELIGCLSDDNSASGCNSQYFGGFGVASGYTGSIQNISGHVSSVHQSLFTVWLATWFLVLCSWMQIHFKKANKILNCCQMIADGFHHFWSPYRLFTCMQIWSVNTTQTTNWLQTETRTKILLFNADICL